MKLYFQYNSKSRGQNVPKADAIADETGYEMENNFKIIEFDAPRDPALLKLYHLVGNLKGTTIFIEEQIFKRSSKRKFGKILRIVFGF